ncbi:hypothetical protein CDAR_394741, partial [Caerostris darwini]
YANVTEHDHVEKIEDLLQLRQQPFEERVTLDELDVVTLLNNLPKLENFLFDFPYLSSATNWCYPKVEVVGPRDPRVIQRSDL